MNAPPPISLVGRPDPALRLSVAISVGAHLCAIVAGLLIASANASPRLIVPSKALVAKLVRLGKKQEETLLPRLRRTPPPPKKSAPIAKPEAKLAPATPDKAKELRAATPDRSLDLDAALAELAETYDRDAHPEEAIGDPNGDKAGSANEAEEGDRYLALVQRAIRSHYQVPTTISEKERLYLNATVIIYVSPVGQITRRELEGSSGNDQFDTTLLRAVDESNPLPPPPEAWRDRYSKEGLGLRFKI